MKAGEYERHPFSARWPEMPGAEVDALANDIRENGQIFPALLFEGKILDGWHRYLACVRADVPLKVETYRGNRPHLFAISANRHRRHCSHGQNALAAAGCVDEWAKRGKSAPGADLPTVVEVAEAAGVSKRTMEQAKVVHANGSEAVKDAVKSGEISLKEAEPIARKPERQQAAALKKAVSGEKPQAPKPEKAAPAEVEKLRARVAELEAELSEMQERLPDLILDAECAKEFKDKTEFQSMKQLRIDLAGMTKSRDYFQNECGQKTAQINHWRKRAEKCEGKK